jgi:hypothetical protein
MRRVEQAFGTLVWVVAAVAAVVAVVTLATSAKSYREIGGAEPARDDEDHARRAAAERDEEIRQMLDAKNARRERRGAAPLDVEAQLDGLTGRGPAVVDKQLREELRDHVVAGNARRLRAGDEPLDVEAEIDRQLRELT